VNVAEELIAMVMAQRAFELNSKVITTSDEIMAATNQIR
jgi:flagellar basal-body rod protein FlgG